MTSTTLFDFASSDGDPASAWQSVDDVVMGGVSESRFEDTGEGAAFTGVVSLEQGGGFASVRSPEGQWDLGAYDDLSLRLRGDGRRYQLTVYTGTNTSLSYRATLEPSSWRVVTVPFDSLVPYERGTRVPNAPPFDPSSVRALGFLIADKQAGPFRLDVEWIQARTKRKDANSSLERSRGRRGEEHR